MIKCPVNITEDNLSVAVPLAGTIKTKSYKLPEIMQQDLRQLNQESILQLVTHGLDSEGLILCDDPKSGKTLRMRSGKYGKYLQIGDDSDKEVQRFSIPHFIDEKCLQDEILAYTELPKKVCVHPQANVTIMLQCSQKGLHFCLNGYSKWYPIPSEVKISQADEVLAMEIVGDDVSQVLNSQKILGEVDGEALMVRKGRFGHYVKLGNIVCGLGKAYDPETISFEVAHDLLKTRGKVLGSSKKKKPKAKKVKTEQVIKVPKPKKQKAVPTTTSLTEGGDEVKAEKPKPKRKSKQVEINVLNNLDENIQVTDIVASATTIVKKLKSPKRRPTSISPLVEVDGDETQRPKPKRKTASKRSDSKKLDDPKGDAKSKLTKSKKVNNLEDNMNPETVIPSSTKVVSSKMQGYRHYLSKMAKTGKTIGEIGRLWREMDEEEKKSHSIHLLAKTDSS